MWVYHCVFICKGRPSVQAIIQSQFINFLPPASPPPRGSVMPNAPWQFYNTLFIWGRNTVCVAHSVECIMVLYPLLELRSLEAPNEARLSPFAVLPRQRGKVPMKHV